MNNQTSVLYTYRNPWPRRLALLAAVLLLLGAAQYTVAERDAAPRRQDCTQAAAR